MISYLSVFVHCYKASATGRIIGNFVPVFVFVYVCCKTTTSSGETIPLVGPLNVCHLCTLSCPCSGSHAQLCLLFDMDSLCLLTIEANNNIIHAKCCRPKATKPHAQLQRSASKCTLSPLFQTRPYVHSVLCCFLNSWDARLVCVW